VFQEDQKIVKAGSQVNCCLAHLDTSTVFLTLMIYLTAISIPQTIQFPSYTTVIKSVYVRVSMYLQNYIKDQYLPAHSQLTHI
jgi:Na+-translocating ferredoxin:NAD+ oxidoreductase RnfE subunit